MAKRRGIKQQLSQLAPTGGKLEAQLKDLMQQGRHSQAIRKLQQALKRDPNQKLAITEADIWLGQGKLECDRGQYAGAETALRQALALGAPADTYYWLAKCLLAQHKEAEALAEFQTAFDQQVLPKDLGGCYLKLLWLNDQVDTVRQLLESKPQRFYAPQLHWARGALALEDHQPQAALPHFQKIKEKDKVTPGDWSAAWQVYAQQQLGNGEETQKHLGCRHSGFIGTPFFRLHAPEHPAVQSLAIAQAAQNGLSLSPIVENLNASVPQQEAAWVLEMIRLIRAEQLDQAGFLMLDIPDAVVDRYPDLQRLYRPLMLLAGQQAHQEQELEDALYFWHVIADQPEFDPNLALHMIKAATLTGDYEEAYQVTQKVLTWVQKQAKQKPEVWPQSRLNSVLARLHCWLADKQIAMGRFADSQRSVRQAEKLAPEHPDVLGRRGLSAALHNQPKVAIPLLTQALEAGCEFREVYSQLLNCLEPNREAVKAARRKFGQKFGDIGFESEVDIPGWVEPLSFRSYWMMADFVESAAQQTPALQALEIFLDSAEDEPSSSQKITLNQEEAVPRWDRLLEASSPAEQVEALKAIYLVIQQHARRNQKGIAALQSRYGQQISQLTSEVPAARTAHLLILALKNLPSDRFEIAVGMALRQSTQPGRLLAQAQLQLRCFDETQVFAPFIDTYLQQDPQNPLLLLAKATLYPPKSQDFKSYYDQGFDLARRLQDTEALQAYREADWVTSQNLTRKAMGKHAHRGGDFGPLDMLDVLQRMTQEAFGSDVPPEVLQQLLPELLDQMLPGFEDKDPFKDDFEPFFLPIPKSRKKSTKTKKRKPWYEL